MADDDEAWPDLIEKAAAHDTTEPKAQAISDYATIPAGPDPEDLKYLEIMQLLCLLGAGNPAVFIFLNLSDRVTSHVVSAHGFFIEERSYRIIYSDPWGSDRSFLQYGNNVAGVAAKHHEEHEWSVSHHELARVLDSYSAIELG